MAPGLPFAHQVDQMLRVMLRLRLEFYARSDNQASAATRPERMAASSEGAAVKSPAA